MFTEKIYQIESGSGFPWGRINHNTILIFIQNFSFIMYIIQWYSGKLQKSSFLVDGQ